MPRMFGNFAPDHVHVDGQIARGGGELRVAEHFLNRTEITPACQQVCGETGTQQVRVVSRPGLVSTGGPKNLVATAPAERVAAVLVHDHPYRATRPEATPESVDKKSGPFTWGERAPDGFPCSQEAGQFLTDGYQPIYSTLAAYHGHKTVRQDITHPKVCQLAGAEPCFVRKAQYQVVSKPCRSRQVRGRKELGNLIFGQMTHQSLVGLRARRHEAPEVWQVIKRVRPPVERAQRRQVDIQRPRGDSSAPVTNVPQHGIPGWPRKVERGTRSLQGRTIHGNRARAVPDNDKIPEVIRHNLDLVFTITRF